MYAPDYLTLTSESTNKKIEFDHTVFDKAIKWVYDSGKFSAEMLSEQPAIDVINETYNVLNKAISSSITHEVPDEMRFALQSNAYIFSGFKTYNSLTEVGVALINDDGTLKSFNQFKDDVQKINGSYNGTYLEAEYDYAISSTQIAVKWNDFIKDGDDYNLQYRTAGDDRVRESHAKLDGITLPPSDKYWELYSPPLGWKCRCNLVQVLKEDFELSDSDVAIKLGEECTSTPKQKIFRYNAGKELKLFPPKHPYLPKGCGDCSRNLQLAYDSRNPMCKACAIISSCQDVQLKSVTAQKWIADTISKVATGKVCKRSIEICSMPVEIVTYAKNAGVELAKGGIKITDSAIRHALRDFKVGLNKAITEQQMCDIVTNMLNAEIYFDHSHNNFVFVNQLHNGFIKYIVNPNYRTKADGKVEAGNQFLTAGVILERNIKDWEKIK